MDPPRGAGRLVVFGVPEERAAVDVDVFGGFKEPTVPGGHRAPFTRAPALDLVARGLIDGGVCMTHRYPLEAFEEAIARRPEPGERPVEQVAVVLDPAA